MRPERNASHVANIDRCPTRRDISFTLGHTNAAGRVEPQSC